MREQGVLAEWNDDRGFGFIDPAAGGPRVFVHISKFPRGRRPALNESLTYSVARDPQGRPNASQVAYQGRDRYRPSARRPVRSALAAATLFAGILVVLVALGRLPILLLGIYGLFSLIAFAFYYVDKSAARQGAWRTSESRLHLIALLGGWPGALIARQVLRHKTVKQPFVTTFWCTVVANVAVLAWLAYETPTWLS